MNNTTIPIWLKWLIVVLFVSIIVGTSSALFLISLEWVTNYRTNQTNIILILPIAGLVIGLMYHYYGKSVNGGNNLLIDTTQTPQQIVPFRMAPLVYIGTIITHLFGGSAGREGTALQMAGAIADQISQPLKLTKEDRILLIKAAIAAGFGSVFGTPFAGVLFALELVWRGKIKVFDVLIIVITALLADYVSHLWGAPHTHYSINTIVDFSIINIIYAIIAGVAFGLCARVFCVLSHQFESLFKNYIKYPPLRPFVGGIVLVAVVFGFNTTKYLGLGVPTIVDSFNAASAYYDFALKLLFTVFSLSAGFKGGEVTPLFFIGATLGSALSIIVPLPYAMLAGMGFVAVFAGATNTPFACMVMGLELFGFEGGIFFAIACLVSYAMSGHNSIYSSQLFNLPKKNKLKRYFVRVF